MLSAIEFCVILYVLVMQYTLENANWVAPSWEQVPNYLLTVFSHILMIHLSFE